jgi:integrase/recombinase XerC
MRTREVALNALVRAVLEEWIKERDGRAPNGEAALFLSAKGARISPRAADSAIRGVAGDAGLELPAHVLRHTCLTNLVRQGEDLVMVAEIAGHVRIETTRRYSLPSNADRQAAMERMDVEF